MLNDERERIEALLPAYVTGRLGVDEAEQVERMLAQEQALADDYRFTRALADAIRSMPGRESPGEPGLQRLRASLARETGQSGRGRGAITAWWRPALAAAAVLVILVQGGLLWQAYRADTAEYAPLSDERAGVIQVRWQADATADEIRRLLRRHRLEVVAGPGASGVFRLRPTGPSADADLEALVARLRDRDAIVAFVATDR